MSKSESREFHLGINPVLTTLVRDGNGIVLGRYKDDLIRFSMAMHGNFRTANDVSSFVDHCANNDWDAVMFAQTAEQVVGFGAVGRFKNGNMLLDVAYVIPEYRMQGVYTKLLEERIAFARQKNAKSVSIEATMSTNMAKSSYIERHGFVLEPDPTDPDESIYKKYL